MEQKIAATLLIITHRHDDRLVRALQCGSWFVHTVVIDNHSQADWAELGKQTNIKFQVVEYPKQVRDFAKLRNWAMKQSPTDWIFFLDSDEYITQPSVSVIRQIVAENTVQAGWVSRTDIFMGQELKHGEAGKHGLIRLMRKDKVQFINPVHEVAVVDGRSAITPIHIYHQAHTSLTQFMAKVALYAELLGQTKVPAKQNLLQLFIYPPLKFFYNYCIRLGFLDGYPGLVYALIMALHSFWVRVFRYEHTTSPR